MNELDPVLRSSEAAEGAALLFGLALVGGVGEVEVFGDPVGGSGEGHGVSFDSLRFPRPVKQSIADSLQPGHFRPVIWVPAVVGARARAGSVWV